MLTFFPSYQKLVIIKMPPTPDMESVGEVTQLLQEWETISRETPLNVERLIGILTKMADVVERETDNFYKQVRIDLCIHVSYKM